MLSAFVALFGVGLLEQGGAAPDIGDAWNLISAFAFGLQVGSCVTAHGPATVAGCALLLAPAVLPS